MPTCASSPPIGSRKRGSRHDRREPRRRTACSRPARRGRRRARHCPRRDACRRHVRRGRLHQGHSRTRGGPRLRLRSRSRGDPVWRGAGRFERGAPDACAGAFFPDASGACRPRRRRGRRRHARHRRLLDAARPAERGFSFQADGPLDMRMAQEGESAADFLNKADEGGDRRRHLPLWRGAEVAPDRPRDRRRPADRADRRSSPRSSARRSATSPARRRTRRPAPSRRSGSTSTRSLHELEGGLAAAEQVLAPGGRLAVVTFHSLEDRIVKRFLKERSGDAPGRLAPPAGRERSRPGATFEAVAKPVRAGEAEIAANPRARSATLRAARRTSAPAWTSPKRGSPR